MACLTKSQSFPRKRESTPQPFGNAPSKDWIPAFAGMTATSSAHVSQLPHYCETWKLKTASEPILLPTGGDCVRTMPRGPLSVVMEVTLPTLKPAFSMLRWTSAMGLPTHLGHRYAAGASPIDTRMFTAGLLTSVLSGGGSCATTWSGSDWGQ